MVLSISNDENIEPVHLWEKVDAIMMDAVTKNLGIEETISTTSGSSHQPYHLLCKSQTVEALDRSNLELLSKIDKLLSSRMNVKVTSNTKVVFVKKEPLTCN